MKIIVSSLLLLLKVLWIPIVVLMPRNRKKIVFGAWSGHQYSCNPKHLFEYTVRRGGFKCYWIGDAILEDAVLKIPSARFLRKGSLLALWHCLTARFYVCNVQWRSDVIDIPRCKRAHLFYLTHGVLDKKLGVFQYNGRGQVATTQSAKHKSRLRKMVGSFLCGLDEFLYGQQSWCSGSSEQVAKLFVENLPWRLSRERMLKCGTPRGDYMLAMSHDSVKRMELRKKIASVLGIPLEKKWYVFVPTWRHNVEYLFSFTTSKRLVEYRQLLQKQNALIIEKQHPKTLEEGLIATGDVDSIKVVSKAAAREIDTQELLAACDRLITDYSSIYYDFVLMDRPVIHFTYDYDQFVNLDTGLCHDIRDYGGGPFAYTEDEFLKLMNQSDNELLAQRNSRTKTEQLAWEKGHACEGYYRLFESLSAEKGYFVV